MKKDIPEIDSLLEGINDPDAMLEPAAQEPKMEPEAVTSKSDSAAQPPSGDSKDQYWNDFMRHLDASDQRSDKDERLNCKLDRDLADSLDDCNIGNRCRSDLVNAIIRAFFNTYLQRLIPYRREKKSLFNNYTGS